MKIRKVELNIGVEKPFTVLHATDSHLCFADMRDNERKVQLGINRANAFTGGHPEKLPEYAEELFAFVKESGKTLIYTGDFIDFVSAANLEYAKKLFTDADVFMAAGNHEYSLYVGEAWEDEDYKKQSFDDVLAAFPCNNIWYDERVINGVKFVAIDNNYYYIMPEQFERFKAACSDGMPVILCVHTPLYSENAYAYEMRNKDVTTGLPFLMGTPAELLDKTTNRGAKRQYPDDLTLEFLDFCNKTPNLKAVIAGHVHGYGETVLDSGIPQITACGGFKGEINEITIR